MKARWFGALASCAVLGVAVFGASEAKAQIALRLSPGIDCVQVNVPPGPGAATVPTSIAFVAPLATGGVVNSPGLNHWYCPLSRASGAVRRVVVEVFDTAAFGGGIECQVETYEPTGSLGWGFASTAQELSNASLFPTPAVQFNNPRQRMEFFNIPAGPFSAAFVHCFSTATGAVFPAPPAIPGAAPGGTVGITSFGIEQNP